MKLDGRVAVVTGGSSGIGLAVAEQLANHGARVVICGRDETRLESARQRVGRGCLAVPCDVSNIGQLDELYRRVEQGPGGIDILVANAGIGGLRLLEDTDEEYFDEMMSINCKGVLFTVQRALGLLHPGASVVLLSSSVATMGVAGLAVYSGGKAAVRAMARAMACELAPRGIRVNVLAPGPFRTALVESDGDGEAHEAALASYIDGFVPLKRWGALDEISRAALFLASDDSGYMTSQELVVDGGQNSHLCDFFGINQS